jgi:hypothetical protein
MLNNDTIIVLPTFEDSKATARTIGLLQEMGNGYKLLVVEDGSIVNPLDIEMLKKTTMHGELITLNRNLGNQRALAVGLNYASAHLKFRQLVLMDSDGEDKPEFVPLILKELLEPNTDVVVASRTTRQEKLKFRILYSLYKFTFRILVGKKMDFGNFSAISEMAAKRLSSQAEIWTHIGATILSTNLRIKRIPLPRGARFSGSSKTNTNALIRHGLRSIGVFQDVVKVRALLFFVTIQVFSLITYLFKKMNLGISGYVQLNSAILLGIILYSLLIEFILLVSFFLNVSSNTLLSPEYEKFVKKIEVF